MAVYWWEVGTGSNYVGIPNAYIYNPFTNNWTRLPDMNNGRWYPTNTTLPNGDVLVVSGWIDTTQGVNVEPQVWQTATSSWRNLTQRTSLFRSILLCM